MSTPVKCSLIVCQCDKCNIEDILAVIDYPN